MKQFLLLFFFLSCQFSCTNRSRELAPVIASELVDESKPTYTTLDGLDTLFEKEQVIGSFIWFDLNKQQYQVYNDSRIRTRFPPASTFKLLNALIALETGVVKDTSERIKWDGTDRGWDRWNKDQTLASGMRYSALWAYQELARRVHQIDSNHYPRFLNLANYGNQVMSNSVDQFWLDNSLQITPLEQIDFLVDLYTEKLPFEPENIELVKEISFVKKLGRYAMHGKTGLVRIDTRYIGWYVGFVEAEQEVYFYCTNIENLREIKRVGDFRNIYIGLTESIIEGLLSKD